MRAEKKEARFPCKHKGTTNEIQAHSAGGRARGGVGQWHVQGRSSVFRQTQEGKCKEPQLICILLLFQRRQNVLEHKVMAESTTEGLCLHIESKKKEKERGKWLLAQHQLETILCNDVKPGWVYKGERTRTREAKTSPDKELKSSCFAEYLNVCYAET